MHVSGFYGVFPQHCIMPAFTREEHLTAANDKLQEAILDPNKRAKKRLLKAMATSMTTMTATINAPPHRVDEPPTSEGVPQSQRVGPAPPVTTTTNPTAPVIVQTAPQTHQRTARHNTPGITLAIERPATRARKSPRLNPVVVQDTPTHLDVPNSNFIPFFSLHNMISQEALNLVTQTVWNMSGDEWMPRDFLDHSLTE